MSLVGVVLAAGASSRMGRSKLDLAWADSTVLGQTLTHARQAGLAELLVVTGGHRDRVEPIALAAGATTVHNPDYALGMMGSLQTAVRALPSITEAILILLGDQPALSPAVIAAMVAAFVAGQGRLLVPRYQGQSGHPVVMATPYLAEILSFAPSEMPRALLARFASAVRYVDIDSATLGVDVDTPEDYTNGLRAFKS